MLLAKTKSNTIEVLISKALTDSYINQDKLVSVSNVLREYNEMTEEIKSPKNSRGYTIKKKRMGTYCVSCKKNTANYNSIGRRPRKNRLMLVSNSSICDKKKSKFIKDQEASRLELH